MLLEYAFIKNKTSSRAQDTGRGERGIQGVAHELVLPIPPVPDQELLESPERKSGSFTPAVRAQGRR